MDFANLARNVRGIIEKTGGADRLTAIAEHVSTRAGINSAIVHTLGAKAKEIMADGKLTREDVQQQLSELAAEHGVSQNMIGHVVKAVAEAASKK